MLTQDQMTLCKNKVKLFCQHEAKRKGSDAIYLQNHLFLTCFSMLGFSVDDKIKEPNAFKVYFAQKYVNELSTEQQKTLFQLLCLCSVSSKWEANRLFLLAMASLLVFAVIFLAFLAVTLPNTLVFLMAGVQLLCIYAFSYFMEWRDFAKWFNQSSEHTLNICFFNNSKVVYE